jgi:hypothetical protein
VVVVLGVGILVVVVVVTEDVVVSESPPDESGLSPPSRMIDSPRTRAPLRRTGRTVVVTEDATSEEVTYLHAGEGNRSRTHEMKFDRVHH